MLRLSVSTTSRWLDLPHGVRVRVRPLTTAVEQAARTETDQRLQAVRQEADVAAKAGQPLDPAAPNGANAAWLVGLHIQYLTEALARYGIEEWEGLTGDDGAPLPVTPAACAAFAAHHDLSAAFWAAYRAPVVAVAAEGNGSGSTSGGGGAAAPSIAADAMAAPNGPPAETHGTDLSAPAALAS